MIYLAAPYTHPLREIREARFRVVTAVAGVLMKRGFILYSPVTHGHTVHEAVRLPEDWKFWRRQSLEILKRAGALYVLELPDWHVSVGVQAEIEKARHLGIPVLSVSLEEARCILAHEGLSTEIGRLSYLEDLGRQDADQSVGRQFSCR